MTLVDLLTGWLDLFARREDVEVTVNSREPGVAEPLARYPDDARAFARHAAQLNFSWRLREDPDVDGFLYLDLSAVHEPVHLVLPEGPVPQDDLFALDVDVDGVGLAAWFVLPEGTPPRIVWSVEDLVLFPSLTDYLTRGARRAFAYGGHPWQRFADTADALGQRSLPASTPPEELRRHLIERGAPDELADGLLAWLGPDVRLLLPA